MHKRSLDIDPGAAIQYAQYVPEWLTVQFVINNSIAFAPLFSYGSTIYSIEKRESCVGFSVDICCTMMVSSILRINFYFIKPFELTLLKQAAVMIFIHCLLLHSALRYKLQNYSISSLHEHDTLALCLQQHVWMTWERRESLGPARFVFEMTLGTLFVCVQSFVRFFDPYYRRSWDFWQWSSERTYWTFLLSLAAASGIATCMFRKHEFYGSFVGTVSLLIESLLPLPQILLLNRTKSVNGFKTILLMSWYFGDLTKISYLVFGAQNISFVFIFFAVFQMILDLIIGFQYVYYKHFFMMDYKELDLEKRDAD